MPIQGQISPVEVRFRERGYALLESHHEEGFFMDWRSDSFPKVLMFVGGEGILEMENVSFAIRAPMVYVIPQKHQHRIVDTAGKPLSVYGICLKEPLFPSQSLVQTVCEAFSMENDPRRMQRIEEWLRQLMAEERQQQRDFEDAQQCLISWILLELARAPKNEAFQVADSRYRVETYIAALETEFWKNEDMDTVARTLGLSRRRFTQLFRDLAGESWQKRVSSLRMHYAADLLKTSSISIRSIAFECGYKDLSHFYRVFKQATGQTPKQFIENQTTD